MALEDNTFHSSTDSSWNPGIPEDSGQNLQESNWFGKKSRYLDYILLPNKVMALNSVLYHPPHNPHGLHWIPLDSTGLHWTSLDFTI